MQLKLKTVLTLSLAVAGLASCNQTPPAAHTSEAQTSATEARLSTLVDGTVTVREGTALPEQFPNEDDTLISPEGQKILDAMNNGDIQIELNTPMQPLELDPEGLQLDLSAQATSVQTMIAIHNSTMPDFLRYQANQYKYPDLNWSNDGCSFSPDATPYYNFNKPCVRHDFGYRNYKQYGIFTNNNRLHIDNKFLADMKDTCAAGNWLTRPRCYEAAYVYYGAVRGFGGL